MHNIYSCTHSKCVQHNTKRNSIARIHEKETALLWFISYFAWNLIWLSSMYHYTLYLHLYFVQKAIKFSSIHISWTQANVQERSQYGSHCCFSSYNIRQISSLNLGNGLYFLWCFRIGFRLTWNNLYILLAPAPLIFLSSLQRS